MPATTAGQLNATQILPDSTPSFVSGWKYKLQPPGGDWYGSAAVNFADEYAADPGTVAVGVAFLSILSIRISRLSPSWFAEACTANGPAPVTEHETATPSTPSITTLERVSTLIPPRSSLCDEIWHDESSWVRL